jgi:N-acetylglucosaminyldiphosphoundecaprenol N-acetyl-beta-D-mannosaminyltransferase
MTTERILDYKVNRDGRDACVDRCMAWLAAGGPTRYFVCANPHSLEVARTHRLFDSAIRKADLVLPDGVGIVLASRILGGAIADRVTGSDLFHGVCRRLDQRGGGRCFFLGSTPETLEAIRERMARAYPNVTVAGTFSPPFAPAFSEAENREMIHRINRSRPDALWVGMTAPKQECWIYRNREQLAAPLAGPVGAVFDFFAGTVPRSHPWFQRRGLEWLPRLLKQPRRLWQRNFVSAPAFLWRVARRRWRSPPATGGPSAAGERVRSR